MADISTNQVSKYKCIDPVHSSTLGDVTKDISHMIIYMIRYYRRDIQ